MQKKNMKHILKRYFSNIRQKKKIDITQDFYEVFPHFISAFPSVLRETLQFSMYAFEF